MTSATTAHVFFAAALSTTGSNYQETLHTIDDFQMPPEATVLQKYAMPILVVTGILAAGALSVGIFLVVRRKKQ